jgi:hypothetical protein
MPCNTITITCADGGSFPAVGKQSHAKLFKGTYKANFIRIILATTELFAGSGGHWWHCRNTSHENVQLGQFVAKFRW